MVVNVLESAGLVYFYICGIVEKNEVHMVTVDSYRCFSDTFYVKVKEMFVEEDGKVNHIFGVMGDSDKVDYIGNIICEEINNNYQKIINNEQINKSTPLFDNYGNSFFKVVQEFFCEYPNHFPREFQIEKEYMKVFTVYAGEAKSDAKAKEIETILKYWLTGEEPVMFGRQLMIRSFFLKDLIGRKIVECLPNSTLSSWNLLIEGGAKLPLGENNSYTKEGTTFNELGFFSVSGTNNTLIDPVYGLGVYLMPTEICIEWHKVFLFACAVSKQEWTMELIQEIYDKFFRFLLTNICIDSREVGINLENQTILTYNKYFEILLKQIKIIRGFLQGKDEFVVSKDLLQTLNSRYVYLPYIYNFLDLKNLDNRIFNKPEFNKKIENAILEIETFKKGVLWEEVADYFIECISGLEISAKRIKAGYQEIDCSVINVSLNDYLWQLGAYILVECKNWNKKVGLPQIRNIAYISNMKGNKTAILFTTKGITQKAKEEIERLVQMGTYILCIDKNELNVLKSNGDCLNLLLDKWEELEAIKKEYLMV